jgi:hypothetical protein
MKNLDYVIEEMHKQKFNYSFNNSNTIPNQDKKKDILFFPRKKLKLRKIRVGNFETKSFFINERLNEKSISLDELTENSFIGLSSGLRSGIVLDEKGYVKLKGICLKNSAKGYQGYRGRCSINEAFFEQFNAKVIMRTQPYISVMRPLYVEGVHHLLNPLLSKETTFTFFKTDSGESLKTLIDSGIKIYTDIHKKFKENDLRFVSAFRINGDTRLDEAIYHLTLKDVRGEKKTVRDELLVTLCFLAGVSKAYLTKSEFSWSRELEYTPNHIGNFVLSTNKVGNIMVGIADLSGLNPDCNFKEGKFYDYTKKELNSFKEDFDDSVAGMTARVKFKYFPRSVKEKCFNALKTGYYSALLYERNKSGIIFPVEKPSNLIVPSNVYMPENQFREETQRVMS